MLEVAQAMDSPLTERSKARRSTAWNRESRRLGELVTRVWIQAMLVLSLARRTDIAKARALQAQFSGEAQQVVQSQAF